MFHVIINGERKRLNRNMFGQCGVSYLNTSVHEETEHVMMKVPVHTKANLIVEVRERNPQLQDLSRGSCRCNSMVRQKQNARKNKINNLGLIIFKRYFTVIESDLRPPSLTFEERHCFTKGSSQAQIVPCRLQGVLEVKQIRRTNPQD